MMLNLWCFSIHAGRSPAVGGMLCCMPSSLSSSHVVHKTCMKAHVIPECKLGCNIQHSRESCVCQSSLLLCLQSRLIFQCVKLVGSQDLPAQAQDQPRHTSTMEYKPDVMCIALESCT